MKDYTRQFPMGCGKNYTVIDVSHCRERLRSVEHKMLEWLEYYDDQSWFAWERPADKMIFEDKKIATIFALRWT